MGSGFAANIDALNKKVKLSNEQGQILLVLFYWQPKYSRTIKTVLMEAL